MQLGLNKKRGIYVFLIKPLKRLQYNVALRPQICIIRYLIIILLKGSQLIINISKPRSSLIPWA